jgi:hypothetical protein
MSGSASFQSVRKSWYAALALVVSPCMGIRAAKAEMRERPHGHIVHKASVVDDQLEFRSGLRSLMCR